MSMVKNVLFKGQQKENKSLISLNYQSIQLYVYG
jgi:hypothetical protein